MHHSHQVPPPRPNSGTIRMHVLPDANPTDPQPARAVTLTPASQRQKSRPRRSRSRQRRHRRRTPRRSRSRSRGRKTHRDCRRRPERTNSEVRLDPRWSQDRPAGPPGNVSLFPRPPMSDPYDPTPSRPSQPSQPSQQSQPAPQNPRTGDTHRYHLVQPWPPVQPSPATFGQVAPPVIPAPLAQSSAALNFSSSCPAPPVPGPHYEAPPPLPPPGLGVSPYQQTPWPPMCSHRPPPVPCPRIQPGPPPRTPPPVHANSRPAEPAHPPARPTRQTSGNPDSRGPHGPCQAVPNLMDARAEAPPPYPGAAASPRTVSLALAPPASVQATASQDQHPRDDTPSNSRLRKTSANDASGGRTNALTTSTALAKLTTRDLYSALEEQTRGSEFRIPPPHQTATAAGRTEWLQPEVALTRFCAAPPFVECLNWVMSHLDFTLTEFPQSPAVMQNLVIALTASGIDYQRRIRTPIPAWIDSEETIIWRLSFSDMPGPVSIQATGDTHVRWYHVTTLLSAIGILKTGKVMRSTREGLNMPDTHDCYAFFARAHLAGGTAAELAAFAGQCAYHTKNASGLVFSGGCRGKSTKPTSADTWREQELARRYEIVHSASKDKRWCIRESAACLTDIFVVTVKEDQQWGSWGQATGPEMLDILAG